MLKTITEQQSYDIHYFKDSKNGGFYAYTSFLQASFDREPLHN